MSASGSPISSARTPSGTGTAMSATKSARPSSITESIVRVTRALISPSIFKTVFGTNAVCRILRYLVCSGGSLYSSRLRVRSSGTTWSGLRKIPPACDENVSGSRLTAITSSRRVIDQKPEPSAVAFQRTGASRRMRANSA